jgi:hypothetical protein
MLKRVQRLRSLRKSGEAFETTFRLLEDCESALAICKSDEDQGAVVVRFWTTREAMQALKPHLVKALNKGWASRGVHKKRKPHRPRLGLLFFMGLAEVKRDSSATALAATAARRFAV